MSMKRMVSYVCYAVAALALLAVAFLQLSQQADVGLALLFAVAFGAGNQTVCLPNGRRTANIKSM